MHSYDEETGICTDYFIDIEAIQVSFDCTWSSGATVSFYVVASYSGGIERLFGTKRECPKEFRWKLRRPQKVVERDIVIEYEKDGFVRSDVVATRDDMLGMAQQAEYDQQGEARVEIKHTFSFGTSSSWFKVKRLPSQSQRYWWHLSLRIVLEFAHSDACLRFIQHDIPELGGRHVKSSAILSESNQDVLKAIAPLALNYCHAMQNAIDCGLSLDDFKGEFAEPETQSIHYGVSAPAKNHARPCFLMLHLLVRDWAPRCGRLSYISQLHWTATDTPRASPSCSNPFQHLNNFHFKLPSPGSQDHNDDSSSPPHSSHHSISFSEQGVPFFDGTSISAGNGLRSNRVNRAIVINDNGAVMGDAYFGPIHRSIIGGTNNTNHIQS